MFLAKYALLLVLLVCLYGFIIAGYIIQSAYEVFFSRVLWCKKEICENNTVFCRSGDLPKIVRRRDCVRDFD